MCQIEIDLLLRVYSFVVPSKSKINSWVLNQQKTRWCRNGLRSNINPYQTSMIQYCIFSKFSKSFKKCLLCHTKYNIRKPVYRYHATPKCGCMWLRVCVYAELWVCRKGKSKSKQMKWKTNNRAAGEEHKIYRAIRNIYIFFFVERY